MTLLTSNVAANTKGAYAQLIASTVGRNTYLILWARLVGTDSFLIDLSIGAAGAEVVLIPNIPAFQPAASIDKIIYAGKVDIAAGSRIAARCQDASGGLTCRVGGILARRT